MHHSKIIHSTAGEKNWHEVEAAKRVLRSIDEIDNPVRYLRGGRSLSSHKTEWYDYDREDPRVMALDAIQCAVFELTGNVGPDVDAVITAHIEVCEAQSAYLDRVAHFLNEGYCLGEARQMAGEPDLPEGLAA